MKKLLSLVGALLTANAVIAADSNPADVEFFEKKIRPVLAERCFKCHSTQAKKLKGDLLLDSRAGVLKGGESGKVVVPGRPDKSRLIEAIRYKNVDLQMPPQGKLPEHVIADLTAWVARGAPWPDEKGPVTGPNRYAFDLAKRKREHWAWQPVHVESPPRVKNTAWPVSPIDHFILAKLEDKGLTPALPADRRTLLRRVHFDLIGLPPTPAEAEAFLVDKSPEALAKVVDRLLASPHFGERWARHWLDLVRYAESRGHEFDYNIPNAYQYRDYVIRALNADVAYDLFVKEHIAGDLLPRPRLHPKEGLNESILGTGFWFLGEQVHSPVDICQDKADRFDNMLDVMTKTFLGLTVSCARCHDHKFDAISTRDYYSLSGFLESSSYRLVTFDSLAHNRQVAARLWKLRDESRPALQKALARDLKPGLERLADYLLAAREASSGQGKDARRLEDIAQARKLDAAILKRWVEHLATAARDSRDPLHPWAKTASDPMASVRLSEVLQPLVEAWKNQSRAAEQTLKASEIIVDYSRPSTDAWSQDGYAFGPRPTQPGDLQVRGDPVRPSLRLTEHAAAEKDAAWDRLRVVSGAENEPGSLGRLIRSGRTLRTPTFKIKQGRVFYLVRGRGLAYAAVEGHVMIAGPLHAQIVMDVNAGPGFRWIGHDLSRYKGHRAHIEFTPADGADFAVAMVVQADQAPALVDPPNQALLNILDKHGRSLDALAGAYQAWCKAVVARLESDRIGSTDEARLVNWLLDHSDLLGIGAQAEWPRAAIAFLADEAKVTAQIKADSRLAPAMLDGSGVDEHVFIRGSYKTPGERAPRRFLEALAGPAPLAGKSGSGRLELADLITDPKRNPFVARVFVNRVWHHLFGRGIVASTDNFGVLGEPPTHPELLDYLADRFVKDGWSTKKLIRALVLTRTYHMSTGGRIESGETAAQADPQNLLLQRMRIRRLEGEAIRDAMLAVSGRLDLRLFGPPVPVYLNAFQDGRGRPGSGPLDGNGRRSLYLSVRRNFLPAMLLAFDTPIPFSTVGRRTVSNVPAQALILLNDPFVHQQAEVWARSVLARPASARDRVSEMYLRALSRPPTAAELTACLEFIDRQAELYQNNVNAQAVWAGLAHVLFNTKEFVFLQ
jgi:hypothetical protein